MINIKNKIDCCGCEVCSQVCMKHAITMTQDSQGFLYPKVDVNLCNNCGLCEKICPLSKEYEPRTPMHTYAVKNNDEEVRMNSSSGGLFTILAEETINKGGVVYGAVFDEEWNVRHDRIDTIEGIARLRGSKYVQSRMDGIYERVRKDLQEGLPVLFSGCHCHIAALLSFLRKKYDNLTTVDVICGGVPSPRIWRDYLNEEIESFKKNSGVKTAGLSSISSIKFRDKMHGWRNYHFNLQFVKNADLDKQYSVNTLFWDNSYLHSWLNQFISRPSCNSCHFRHGRCGSDFTIADYWCIEHHCPDFADDKGVNMFLYYNDEIPNFVKSKVSYIETTFKQAASGQTAVVANHTKTPARELFYFLHDKLHCGISTSLKICLIFDPIPKKNFLIKIIFMPKRMAKLIYRRICQKS